MLSLGLVTSVIINYFLFPKGQNRFITGFYWGISILIPSLLTTFFFGTAEYNPVVSLTLAVNHQIHWWLMIGEILTQILGAWLASLTVKAVWSKWLASLPLNLNFYATVPRDVNNWKRNFKWEIIGTFLIIVNTEMQNDINAQWWIKTLFSSLLMMIIISIVAPITGAAFNPTRDLVPRFFFSRTYDKRLSQWRYAVVPFLGPIIGAILGIIFSVIFSHFVYKSWWQMHFHRYELKQLMKYIELIR